jgi:hypothetical protein
MRKLIVASTIALILACLAPTVMAIQAPTRFYVKMYGSPGDTKPVGVGHILVGNYSIFEFINWGKVVQEGGNINSPPIGHFEAYNFWVIDTVHVKSVVYYTQVNITLDIGPYAGKTFQLYGFLDIYVFPGGNQGGAVLGGYLVGHVDGRRVAGQVEPIEVFSAYAFDGNVY